MGLDVWDIIKAEEMLKVVKHLSTFAQICRFLPPQKCKLVFLLFMEDRWTR